MKLTRSQSIAAASALLLLSPVLQAARRPRYGGELRIETRTAIPSADLSEEPADLEQRGMKIALLGQVFESLVRMDENGQLKPWLAAGWTHEPARRRWVFAARANVVLHDGSIWAPPDGVITVPDSKPIGEILLELSQPAAAIVVRAPNGTPAGTGPFRIAHWEPGKMVQLEAHERYWRGRPYLDAVQIRTVPEARERLLNLDLGKTDAAEVQVTEIRRLQQAGIAVQVSRPADGLALVFETSRVPVTTREALSLSIDRSAIQRVLLDRQGDISGALLPQWLSGYAFLFRSERNLVRAKTLAKGALPLTFGYDRDDLLIRSIGERIAVNATEAGLTLRYSGGACDVRLKRLPLMSLNVLQALNDYAGMLGVSLPQTASPYDAELALLDHFRVIPLFHLPSVFALRGNVRNFTAPWRLDDVWLDRSKAIT